MRVREQLDVAGHAAREPPGEREAEPGSVRPARLAEPATDARFEDALSLVVGDARAVVRDEVANRGVSPLDRDAHTRRAVAARVLEDRLQDPLGEVGVDAEANRPVRLFDFSLDLSQPYTFWAGVIGGAVLAMASHGADQLIVQRLLACRGLRDAQKALVGSGVLVILQFTLFLALGVGLFAFYGGRAVGPGGFPSSDAILPTFIVRSLPPFVSAYLVAGIFSAAMCSESSALNSLASALSLDFVAPLLGKKYVEGRRGLVLGKLLTLFWTLVLAGLAVGFSRLPQNVPAVQVALGLASVTAGGLLGAFLLALWARKATQTDAMAGIGASAVFMFVLWLGSKGWIPFPLGRAIAWPWYSLLGSTIAFGTGWLLSQRHAAEDPRLTSRA